jgi:hypothetical protein
MSPRHCWRPAWPSAGTAVMNASGMPGCTSTAGSAPGPASAASRPAGSPGRHQIADRPFRRPLAPHRPVPRATGDNSRARPDRLGPDRIGVSSPPNSGPAARAAASACRETTGSTVRKRRDIASTPTRRPASSAGLAEPSRMPAPGHLHPGRLPCAAACGGWRLVTCCRSGPGSR